MDFKTGCNYWASNAGTEMWKKYDREVIERDLSTLKKYGMDYLRVFPNWRDFQPVSFFFEGAHNFKKYLMTDETYPTNRYYLDDKMMSRFSDFCDIAEKNNIKLIVGLLTGWMSGRLFIPQVLYDKNIYTDPVAQNFAQKFVSGFVSRTKDKKAIYAWDLGNECNCMDKISVRDEAENWTMLISNAIRVNDNTRPIVSGMHGLEIDGKWTIGDQAKNTDILTTHPYPYFVEHCSESEITSVQTLMHATCQTKYYSEIGQKPCLVEETGTMGPMVCDEETAAEFLKVNLYSNWANGAEGLFWWCAHDQNNLFFPPYDCNMCERELGLLDGELNPKPVLKEFRQFSDWLKQLQEKKFNLPQAHKDGVCLLTNGQDNWGIAYMTYVLAKQAGTNISFAYADDELPEAEVYLMPSVRSVNPLSAQQWDRLKERINNGAVLYISNDDVILAGFEELSGLRVHDSKTANDKGKFELNNKLIEYSRSRCLRMIPNGAEVLLQDEMGDPLMSVSRYGKGTVYYLNFPLEKDLIGKWNAFEGDSYEIYRVIFDYELKKHPLSYTNKKIGMTLHKDHKNYYAVLINYSPDAIDPGLKISGNYKTEQVMKGSIEKILPFETTIVKLNEIQR